MVVDMELQRETIRQIVADFTLLDDEFMAAVFQDKECVELFLHIVLERDDLTVQSVKSHYELKNLYGHSTILDVYATDRENRVYNVEIQRSDAGAASRRARYYSSVIDANSLGAGKSYEELPETYVIFVTENDVLKGGLPLYHIERRLTETGEPFHDGAHILYVNAKDARHLETALGKLMQDFSCKAARDMHYAVLAKRVHYYKETEGGTESMCRAVEKLYNDGVKRGKEDGIKIGEKRRDTAIVRNMLGMGMSHEQIALALGLPLERIREIETECKDS